MYMYMYKLYEYGKKILLLISYITFYCLDIQFCIYIKEKVSCFLLYYAI